MKNNNLRIVLIFILFASLCFTGAYIGAKKDAATGVDMGIDYRHHKIHSGNHYFLDGYTVLGDGDTLAISVTTPNTAEWSHVIFDISSSLGMHTELWEGATSTTGGVAVTPVNNNRNSANTSSLVFAQAPTFVLGGATKISKPGWGSNKAGGATSIIDEIIFKQNTIYIRLFISDANTNTVGFKVGFYEHTNVN